VPVNGLKMVDHNDLLGSVTLALYVPDCKMAV
jgi:hypothetical protein